MLAYGATAVPVVPLSWQGPIRPSCLPVKLGLTSQVEGSESKNRLPLRASTGQAAGDKSSGTNIADAPAYIPT